MSASAPRRTGGRRISWLVVAAGLSVAAACGRADDRISGPEPSTTTAGTDEPHADVQATSSTEATTSSSVAGTTSTTAATITEDDTGASGGGGDGPFGRGVGPGSIAPAPPAGPLVDGSAGSGRPVVVVKIDNIDAAWPQAGINQADVTFEILVEGVSRLAAAFNSEDAALVGPVRSARTSDVNLLSMLERPCFAFSGGNSSVVQAVDAAPLIDISAEVAAGPYFRAGDREAPHNLMTSSSALRSACRGAGTPSPIFDYATGGDLRGGAVGGVALRLGATAARFEWDPGSGRWLRFVGEYGQVDVDGVQVSPRNVVVLETSYLPSPADNRSPEAQTLGSGRAWVLLDGRAIPGSWQRSSATQPYRLVDDDGAPLTLQAGRTWVTLAPPGTVELLG